MIVLLHVELRVYVCEAQSHHRQSCNPIEIQLESLERSKSIQFIHAVSTPPLNYHKHRLLVFDHTECENLH